MASMDELIKERDMLQESIAKMKKENKELELNIKSLNRSIHYYESYIKNEFDFQMNDAFDKSRAFIDKIMYDNDDLDRDGIIKMVGEINVQIGDLYDTYVDTHNMFLKPRGLKRKRVTFSSGQ